MALTDRDALVALFRSTGGASWDKKGNWDTATEIATWSGVQVNDEGRVVKLHLKSNNLQGNSTFAAGTCFYLGVDVHDQPNTSQSGSDPSRNE